MVAGIEEASLMNWNDPFQELSNFLKAVFPIGGGAKIKAQLSGSRGQNLGYAALWRGWIGIACTFSSNSEVVSYYEMFLLGSLCFHVWTDEIGIGDFLR